MNVQQLVCMLLAHFIEHPHDHGVALSTLEHGGMVHILQSLTALKLCRLETVRLSGAADAAALAGHNFDQVIELPALVDLLKELPCVDKTVDDCELELRFADMDRCFLDRRIAAKPEELDLAKRVLALIRQAVAHDRFGNAARLTVNDCRAGAESERKVGRFQLQLIELNARLKSDKTPLLSDNVVSNL